MHSPEELDALKEESQYRIIKERKNGISSTRVILIFQLIVGIIGLIYFVFSPSQDTALASNSMSESKLLDTINDLEQELKILQKVKSEDNEMRQKELDDTILKLTNTISSVQNLAAQPSQAPQPEKSDEEKTRELKEFYRNMFRPMESEIDCSRVDYSFPLPQGAILTDTNPGFKMWVYGESKSADIVSWFIRQDGEWEAGEYGSMELKPNSTVIDIGGNLCWWTLNWAHAGHTVYTFEPLRSNINLCAHSICENNFNDKIHLYNIGLSDRPQQCQLWSTIDNFGDPHTFCSDMDRKKYFGSMGQYGKYFMRDVFTAAPLDNAIECPEGGFDFMKLDTEGYIKPVVNGGKNVMGCTKQAMIEIWKDSDTAHILQYTNFKKTCRDAGCEHVHEVGRTHKTGPTDVWFFP